MSTDTPFPGASSRDADENQWWLRREISLIQNLLEEEGETAATTSASGSADKY